MDSAPPTLFEIYEHLLLRIQSRPKSTQYLVKAALTWIFYAREPLSIEELCEAVSICTSGTISDKKPVPAALKQIRKFCGSLIRETADGTRLEAAHFTVKEFFSSLSKDLYPHIASFCLSRKEAYREFSKVCLIYLNLKDFQKPIPAFDNLEDAFQDNQFHLHASLY